MNPTYKLSTRYDSRASFYGKAKVEDHGADGQQLISYTTHVATVWPSEGKAEVYGTYSATTLRHIKEFLQQHDFMADNTKQIMADYGADRNASKAEHPSIDHLSSVAAVMALGDLFSDDQAGANDWKARMLKAGVPDGLYMPEDWDQLSEDEKTGRLNSVIKALGKN